MFLSIVVVFVCLCELRLSVFLKLKEPVLLLPCKEEDVSLVEPVLEEAKRAWKDWENTKDALLSIAFSFEHCIQSEFTTYMYVGVERLEDVQFYYFVKSYTNLADDSLILWMTRFPGLPILLLSLSSVLNLKRTTALY
ncbi:hypothetical protein POM88_004700 [Heracleum sosnowskyi]|uniref:Uncharacterized protein n=1 Tax=Heracleum sosnowskyi TaxID=360622 RepID=A0AAD8JIF9_9APIA|nr:hypothetical protein POM88_004700 [Heracleum sosnowskyi]